MEKEALAVVWACEKLHLYLYGRRFILFTDNRAIQLIFSNPKSNPPLRIKRWALRLMSYDYEIRHKPGIDNIADYLSRHPLDSITNDFEEVESYISFVAEQAIPRAMTNEELIEETNNDERLVILRKIVRKEEVVDNEILKNVQSEFKHVLNELTVTKEGLILRDTRLVIPSSLQLKVMKIAHEGHQGISKTKSLLRTKVWFSSMDRKVEDLIKECAACQFNGKTFNSQPLQQTPIPARPWEYLAMDFFGPLPNGSELMVVVDEFSRMPVVGEIKTTSSEYVLPKLDDLFSFVGIPRELKTDNGPPFNGHKFKEFSQYLGFKHRKITPEHPQANGQAENFMKRIGAVIRNATVENKNWKQELNSFLRNYRSTPHSSTGVAPSILLFGTNRTNRLPSIIEDARSFDEFKAIAIERDHLSKRKSKRYTDQKRKAKMHNFKIGEIVIIRQKRQNKFSTMYDQIKYVITNIKGSMITVKADDGRQFSRNAERFKRFHVERNQEITNFKDITIRDSTPTIEKPKTTTTVTTATSLVPEQRRSTRQRRTPEIYKSVDFRK